MLALIDGDILRYEVGFAAEASMKKDGEEFLPSWEVVEAIFEERIGRDGFLPSLSDRRPKLSRADCP